MGMELTKRYDVVETHSQDGEIHLIIVDLKLDGSVENAHGLDETQIREVMKKEAEKPLKLRREFE